MKKADNHQIVSDHLGGGDQVNGFMGCDCHIEVFFKQIRQTLQLADFLGTSANAVRWQVWTALLA
ncbi:MAG: family transposase [Pedosphaera sp.]|nr:family transposase [Pedosphaera sp.]